MFKSKKGILITCLVLLVVIVGALYVALFSKDNSYDISYGANEALEKETLSTEDMLRFALQDEFLGLHQYESILEESEQDRPFSNIIQSKKQNILFIESLLEDYKVKTPKDETSSHIVKNLKLEEAYALGAELEGNSVKMYEAFLANELPEDVADLFEQIKSTSAANKTSFEKEIK